MKRRKTHIQGVLDPYVERLRGMGPVLLLESQSPDHPAGRISYLAGKPESVISWRAGKEEDGGENPWDRIAEWYRRDPGWMFGYLGYDLKNYLEELRSRNPDPVGAPDLYFFRPGILLEYRHESGEIRAIRGAVPEPGGISPDEGEERNGERETAGELSIRDFTSSVSRFEYVERIREVQRRIREGDFYELNLSHQMSGSFTGDPFELYRRMREVGPVPFAAYLEAEDLRICSLSPERFLAKHGNRVFSQPIKGTVERGETDAEDRRLRNSLIESAKDRAENLMIVDLVRNDLSRISRQGSVGVRDLFEIQSFGTVHQMVSTIEGEAAVEDPFEIVKACYPMGSMTGAPKIRVMKAIDELENYRRGIYSGAVGYVKPDGDFDFNVVIRSALIKGNRLFYSVGGAITSDSDPNAEWRETLVKGRALPMK